MNSKQEEIKHDYSDWFSNDNTISSEPKIAETNKNVNSDDFWDFESIKKNFKENNFKITDILFEKEDDIDQCSKEFYNFIYN